MEREFFVGTRMITHQEFQIEDQTTSQRILLSYTGMNKMSVHGIKLEAVDIEFGANMWVVLF